MAKAKQEFSVLCGDAMTAVEVLLRYMGEDPDREGLKDTPRRVCKAWLEMTSGYQEDPAEILARDFDAADYDEVIALPWIEFWSTCEHHLLPFSGYAHVAYLPAKKNPRVVGLSKMARLVDCFGRRLQIQEKMTIQIADAMQKHLRPQGVAVVVQAKHLCMACRGVQKSKSVMVTSAMRGVFRRNAAARSEFFRLVDLAAKQNEA
jgi:GTP cyclohydrolase I